MKLREFGNERLIPRLEKKASQYPSRLWDLSSIKVFLNTLQIILACKKNFKINSNSSITKC